MNLLLSVFLESVFDRLSHFCLNSRKAGRGRFTREDRRRYDEVEVVLFFSILGAFLCHFGLFLSLFGVQKCSFWGVDSVLLNGVNGCLNGENKLIDLIGMVGCDWSMLIEFNQHWT